MMPRSGIERTIELSAGVYGALLMLYPKEYREEYGPHMVQVFRDSCRHEVGRAGALGLVALLTRTVLDLLSTAVAERNKAPEVHREVEMKKWLGHIGGAVLMGLTWAVIWAPVAVLLGLIVDPDGSMDEMWVAIGAYPGFLCGVLFSAVLGIAEGRRGFDELSLSRVGAWGAVTGLLVGMLPFLIGESSSELPLWLLGVVVIGSITLLSAVSAVGSALLSRYAVRRHTRAGAGPEG
ncbi:MAG TPA: hypothetical protein VEY13_06070 [Rubrobacteraceae bacterium]|nr:hypothetical protein [Rubrobacteraceae bacterium]